jgi:hypothetical protein
LAAPEAPQFADGLTDRRQALLDEIVTLDEAHEAGRVSPSDYETRRAALKTELLDITRTLKDRQP